VLVAKRLTSVGRLFLAQLHRTSGISNYKYDCKWPSVGKAAYALISFSIPMSSGGAPDVNCSPLGRAFLQCANLILLQW